MQKAIRIHFADHTIIAIAHRLQGILDFDRVIVMDKARIVETGKPTELLAQNSSTFAQMYRVQQGIKADLEEGTSWFIENGKDDEDEDDETRTIRESVRSMDIWAPLS
jgi:energy-coupling factor transporter ATP-binding protein EcfA2